MTPWSVGTGRQGISDPPPQMDRWTWRPGACATYGHPGSTYHPRLDRTWCQCGDVVRDGFHIDWDYKHPASPLKDWWDLEARASQIAAYEADGIATPTYSPASVQGDLLEGLTA